jgi:hypothetical protein
MDSPGKWWYTPVACAAHLIDAGQLEHRACQSSGEAIATRNVHGPAWLVLPATSTVFQGQSAAMSPTRVHADAYRAD